MMCCSTKLCQVHYELICLVSVHTIFFPRASSPAASRYPSVVRLRANNGFHFRASLLMMKCDRCRAISGSGSPEGATTPNPTSSGIVGTSSV